MDNKIVLERFAKVLEGNISSKLTFELATGIYNSLEVLLKEMNPETSGKIEDLFNGDSQSPLEG